VPKDLTASELEEYVSQHGPGSGAAYLENRRRIIAENEEEARKQQRYLSFEASFCAMGGTKEGAREEWDRRRNEDASQAAQRADSEAMMAYRSRLKSIL
jgi:hypothetical protein